MSMSTVRRSSSGAYSVYPSKAPFRCAINPRGRSEASSPPFAAMPTSTSAPSTTSAIEIRVQPRMRLLLRGDGSEVGT